MASSCDCPVVFCSWRSRAWKQERKQRLKGHQVIFMLSSNNLENQQPPVKDCQSILYDQFTRVHVSMQTRVHQPMTLRRKERFLLMISSFDASIICSQTFNCSILTAEVQSSKIVNNTLRNPRHILDEVWEWCCRRAVSEVLLRGGLIIPGSLEAITSITYLVLFWSEAVIMEEVVYVTQWGPK